MCFSSMPNLFFFPFFLPFLNYKNFCYEFGDISRAELLEFIAIPLSVHDWHHFWSSPRLSTASSFNYCLGFFLQLIVMFSLHDGNGFSVLHAGQNDHPVLWTPCRYFFWKKHKCRCNWYLLVVFYGSCLIWLPFSVFLGGIVMSHYTISSTNPVIAEVGNEGATTIEGAGEAHAVGKNKRRLRSFA